MAGVSQPFPLSAARQHAQALAENGDPAGARAVWRMAIAAGRSSLGEDHPDGAGRRAPARPAASAGRRPTTAAGFWRRRTPQANGGSATRTPHLEISYDLGTVAEELGNRHEARKAFARVADTGAAVLGADHWAVARARAYLGDEPAAVRTELAPTPTPQAHGLPAQYRTAGQTEPTFVQNVSAAPSRSLSFGRRRRRGSVIFAAIAACLAAIIALVALVLVLASHQSKPKGNVPTVSGRPPTDIRVEDDGSDVRLTWTDPAAGRTTFLITGGRQGEVLRPLGQVGPGQTSYELHGLNADLDYCFAIVAVYSTTELAPSGQSCTSRLVPRRRSRRSRTAITVIHRRD
jgi:hypothetical protein